MNHKKSIFYIFTLLLWVNICGAGDINLDTFTWSSDQGAAAYDFSISEARFDSQPAWEPGKQPVPLGIDKALQLAGAWIKKQTWSRQFESFDTITLKHQDTCWYYCVNFNLDDEHAGLQSREVIVLLDGSLVEPRLKPKGSKS